jgi:hypothetical protein
MPDKPQTTEDVTADKIVDKIAVAITNAKPCFDCERHKNNDCRGGCNRFMTWLAIEEITEETHSVNQPVRKGVLHLKRNNIKNI